MLQSDNARDGAVNQPGTTDPILTAIPTETDFYKAIVSGVNAMVSIAASLSIMAENSGETKTGIVTR
jgi:hypothetical protein